MHCTFRYDELEEKYGKLDPLANVDLKPKETIKLKVRFLNTMQEVDINIKQTVKDLKKLLSNVVGLPANNMRLHLQQKVDGRIWDTILMRIPSKFLWTYNLRDEDEILVDSKDVNAESVFDYVPYK